MIYDVSYKIRIPDAYEATDKQVADWVKYAIGYIGKMDNKNPLKNADFDPKYGTLKVTRQEGK